MTIWGQMLRIVTSAGMFCGILPKYRSLIVPPYTPLVTSQNVIKVPGVQEITCSDPPSGCGTCLGPKLSFGQKRVLLSRAEEGLFPLLIVQVSFSILAF